MSLRTRQPRIRSIIVVLEEEEPKSPTIIAEDWSMGERPQEMIDEEGMNGDIKEEDEEVAIQPWVP